jgi:hypothetical protein
MLLMLGFQTQVRLFGFRMKTMHVTQAATSRIVVVQELPCNLILLLSRLVALLLSLSVAISYYYYCHSFNLSLSPFSSKELTQQTACKQ